MRNSEQYLIMMAVLTTFVLAGCDEDKKDAEEPDAGNDRASEYGLEWVPIAGGTFMMGSEDGESDEMPVHEVTVPDFEILKTEVTVAQFKPCNEETACSGDDWLHFTLNAEDESCSYGLSDRDDHPMNCIDWHGAVEYCEWAGGRLPTEAEWEYAARSGGLERIYPWGDEDPSCVYAIIAENGGGCGLESTAPVCSRASGNTIHGLCDMVGNVREWVADDYHPDYNGAPADGSAWVTDADERVLRGASWQEGTYERIRIAYRIGSDPENEFSAFGLRCARSSP
jgi:formylglycine-generating enzyme required for sulfatase activity